MSGGFVFYFADMLLRCAGTHGRSLIFPLGNQGYRFVREGNLLASRVCILILVICSQGCRFVLEQPQGSFLEHHPRMSWLFTFLNLVRAAFWGGAFAASPESASAKRHILWSNDPPTLKAVETAAGHLSKSQLESFGMSLVNKKRRQDGSMAFNGNGNMRGSQLLGCTNVDPSYPVSTLAVLSLLLWAGPTTNASELFWRS